MAATLAVEESNPAGRPPHPLSGFSLFPPFPTQDNNRSVPVSEPVPSTYNSAKTAAPAYGLITDLPVPVPPSEVGVNGFTYKMPDLPETFPELSDLSVSQLTDMMEQEDVLLEQFVNLPQLKQIISDKEELVKNIEELAKKSNIMRKSESSCSPGFQLMFDMSKGWDSEVSTDWTQGSCDVTTPGM
ncbi:vacuolar protein sorting-associated protein 37A-like [Phyllobates terribilis]|uniref:vacuolar protein sorting-associated protein 37A-like n=1 Tax=Phyllobates terribilis TaxID=111132 RepID=UPI003CCA7052